MAIPYLISNFKAGVDTRSPIFASQPGTLSIGQDVHLTSGGQLEVRKAFVKQSTLPAGTFGLAAIAADLYVFGSVPTPAPLPTGVFYQRLVHPTGAAMTDLIDVEPFQGQFYALGQYTADVVHFFNGARVPDWQVATETVDPVKFKGGAAVKTLGEKVYVVTGSNLNFCKTGDPTKWQETETGAGFIDMSTHSTGFEDLVGVELYYDSLAVFSQRAVQLWHVVSDPVNNSRIQTVTGLGLIAPRAATGYPDGDVFFLSTRGLRKISPKDIYSGRSKTSQASPEVDKQLAPYIATLTPETKLKALTLVEPEENRLWVFVGDRIYVRSWFPGNQIEAWTEYRPGFVTDWACVCDGRVWLRSGDDLYLYGGANDDEYLSAAAVVRLPYLDMHAPSTFKGLMGIDVGVEGEWEIWTGQRPDDNTSFQRAAIIADSTYDKPDFPIAGTTTHTSMELRHVGTNQHASVVAVTLHFKSNDTG